MDLNSDNLLFPAIIVFWQANSYLSRTAEWPVQCCSPQLAQGKILSPFRPVNLQITAVLPAELPCIPSGEKRKRDFVLLDK